ncbi:putative ER protein processing protein [Scheffersomyces amazonensis]|uniref:putative ER protein processing protein n=1 Tax=Scheffersomyces amazonensis TaxID=1078765 RepID=UPI00315D1562
MHISSLVVVVLSLLTGAMASPGDDLWATIDCKYQCEQISCENNRHYYRIHPDRYYNPSWRFTEGPLPKYLEWLAWDCYSNCDYQCQRIITEERRNNHEEIYQFHGKWPFVRVAGIQEVTSVIFSLGNLVVHGLGLKKIWHKWNSIPNGPAHDRLKSQYINLILMTLVSMGAWIFSTIFHIRDLDITEKLDYYCAGLTVLMGFHTLGARFGELYLESNANYRYAFSAICAVSYAGHIARLVIDWSYTYNMRANIFIGILQNICLVGICYYIYSHYYYLEQDNKSTQNHLKYIDFRAIILPSFFSRSPKLYSLYPLMLGIIVILGMSLEIFDFPPIFYDLVDAHSLWHLVTIFPAYFGWYDWMLWDIHENVWPHIQQVELLNVKKNE